MTGEPCARGGDEQQVEQPVEDRFLPGILPDDLLAEHREKRRVSRVGRHGHEPGEDGQQLPADDRSLAFHPVLRSVGWEGDYRHERREGLR
jgi:hypothetical protein